jgi:hypothetical protein
MRQAASELPQVQQVTDPNNVPTPQADMLPPDVMFPLDPAFQVRWETGPQGARPVRAQAAAGSSPYRPEGAPPGYGPDPRLVDTVPALTLPTGEPVGDQDGDLWGGRTPPGAPAVSNAGKGAWGDGPIASRRVRRTARTEHAECGGSVENGRCRSCGEEAAPWMFGQRGKAYTVVRGIEAQDIDPGLSSEDDEFLGGHGIQASRRVRRTADFMSRPLQSTDDLNAPYNSPQTTPDPFSSNASPQSGDYQAGFSEGQQDRGRGDAPTFSDNSSHVSPYVQGYAAGYGAAPPSVPQDVPGSAGGDSGQGVNVQEAQREWQTAQAGLRRRAHDFTESGRENAAHSLGPDDKLPVNSLQDLKNAHRRAHQVEGEPESAVDSYLSRLDDQYGYHPGKESSLRVSAALVAQSETRSGDFRKGYRFASRWKPGQKLASRGPAAFEAGMYAAMCDAPGPQRRAWIGAHQRLSRRQPDAVWRLERTLSFTRQAVRDSQLLKMARDGYFPRLAGVSTDLITDGPGTSPDPMGQTPLNGPGTPPPSGGGENPARPGGIPPYQGGQPVVADDGLGPAQEPPHENGPFTQTFSGRQPGNIDLAPAAPNNADGPGYENPGAYPSDMRRAQAFRARVQASLRARQPA